MLLNECLYLAELLIRQCTLLLYNGAPVAAYKELSGGTLVQPGIAGVDMHTLDDAEGSVVQIGPQILFG